MACADVNLWGKTINSINKDTETINEVGIEGSVKRTMYVFMSCYQNVSQQINHSEMWQISNI
jgi:hypothetical protein